MLCNKGRFEKKLLPLPSAIWRTDHESAFQVAYQGDKERPQQACPHPLPPILRRRRPRLHRCSFLRACLDWLDRGCLCRAGDDLARSICFLRDGLRGQPLAPRGQAIDQAEYARDSESEEGGDGQVEGDGRFDAGEFDEDGDDLVAVVVVVHRPAGEIGVVGREVGRFDHGVQEGEFHELLAALPGLPQVGIQQADEDEQQEGGGEQALAQEE